MIRASQRTPSWAIASRPKLLQCTAIKQVKQSGLKSFSLKISPFYKGVREGKTLMVLNVEGGYFINSWNLMPDWEAEGEHGLHGLYERSRLTACRGAGVTSMYDVRCTLFMHPTQ